MNTRYLALVVVSAFLVGCPKGHVLYTGQAGSTGLDIWDVQVEDGAPVGTPVNLTAHAGDDTDADWNQPIRKIAFASTRNGNFDIYTMDRDGSNLLQLTTLPATERFPSWEFNGDRMVYASDEDGDFEIMRMEDRGSRKARLTSNNCLDTEPQWSPDGAKIVYVSDCAGGGDLEIFVMDANGTNITRLTNRPGMDDFHPTWSPDGTRIAFESVPAGGNAHTNTEILLMDANGANLQPLSTAVPVGDLIHPSWGPRGTFLAVSMIDASGDYNVYTVNLANGAVRVLVDQPATQWAPDWGDPG